MKLVRRAWPLYGAYFPDAIYTVHNHLRSIFAKVGVRSQGELVKRLFFDNLYPTLFR